MMTFEHDYLVEDATATEREVRNFLMALVAVLRPRLVVETGCYNGGATVALASAITFCRNDGRLVTCDTDAARCRATRTRLGNLVELANVEIRHCRGIELPELREADLAFIDSDYQDREEEVLATKPGAFIVLHDTERSYHSDVPPLRGLVERLGGICFPTWRGFGLIRRAQD